MRKLFFVAIFALFSLFGYAQAVQDNAVIPVSVTINSILRLNVVSGGNIQFVFNTMAQYNAGIPNSDQTTTIFNVASSRPYNVWLGAEDLTLIGVEGGNTMGLDVVEYFIDATEISTGGTGTISSPIGVGARHALVDLTAPDNILRNTAATGGAAPDQCYLRWSAGQTVTASGFPPDVYVTNVYLTLVP